MPTQTVNAHLQVEAFHNAGMPSWSQIVRDEIRRRMNKKGWLEAELARRSASMPQTTLNRFMNGSTRTCQVDTLGRIAKGLGVHPSVLLGGSSDLTIGEQEILGAYKDLPPDDRQRLLVIAQAMRPKE
jgi:hypothetical protein